MTDTKPTRKIRQLNNYGDAQFPLYLVDVPEVGTEMEVRPLGNRRFHVVGAHKERGPDGLPVANPVLVNGKAYRGSAIVEAFLGGGYASSIPGTSITFVSGVGQQIIGQDRVKLVGAIYDALDDLRTTYPECDALATIAQSQIDERKAISELMDATDALIGARSRLTTATRRRDEAREFLRRLS